MATTRANWVHSCVLVLCALATGCAPARHLFPPAAPLQQRTTRVTVLSDPPGALVVYPGADTIGSAPVSFLPSRKGIEGVPAEIYLGALPVQAGQCAQRATIGYDQVTPDTVRFDLTRCPPRDQDLSRLFEDSEVTTWPKRLSSPPVHYPDEQRRAAIPGRVIFRLVIDTTGRADSSSIEVLVASDTAFIPPARYAMLHSTFEPARLYDRKVRVRVRLPVNFTISTGF